MSQKRNCFKAPKKLHDGTIGDLRTHCEQFQMVASDEENMKFLSHLYRTIFLQGGKVTINDGSSRKTYNF